MWDQFAPHLPTPAPSPHWCRLFIPSHPPSVVHLVPPGLITYPRMYNTWVRCSASVQSSCALGGGFTRRVPFTDPLALLIAHPSLQQRNSTTLQFPPSSHPLPTDSPSAYPLQSTWTSCCLNWPGSTTQPCRRSTCPTTVRTTPAQVAITLTIPACPLSLVVLLSFSFTVVVDVVGGCCCCWSDRLVRMLPTAIPWQLFGSALMQSSLCVVRESIKWLW